MNELSNVPSLADCFEKHGLENVTPITKESSETCAWFASTSGQYLFLKLYPHDLAEPRAAI